jgi:hypothetical protein
VSEGLYWNAEGFVALSGPLRELSEDVDRTFIELAATFSAEGQEVGPLLAVRDLRKIDYFSSFPHLITFPACADDDEENLRALARTNSADVAGPLHVPRLAPIDAVLAPAACYGVYISRQQAALSQPQWITVRGTCFRAERSFQPLVRQPSFSMREIVHLGTAESVEAFLREGRERAMRLAGQWGLALSVETATDPFFDPARSPKYLHAKLFPTKQELIYGGTALGSLNNHRNFFGEAFEISLDGQPVHTACIAFGLERWLHAIQERGR